MKSNSATGRWEAHGIAARRARRWPRKRSVAILGKGLAAAFATLLILLLVGLFFSMVLTMGVAGLMGAAIPLALKAVRQDPALGSGVIVTAVVDAFGFCSFLGIATLMLDRLV